ncbi:MAG: PKD domain-containing protein [Chitinophagia bacterium]|nr:PKD domain-containing protein [Chitinophagia bacterium]
MLSKTFTKRYTFPVNRSGYYVAYQRCCRNGQIMNIASPGDQGATYFCYIPPASVAPTNNSAYFINYPPQIICRNNPLNYDHSAYDPDGDSLSYEFCPALLGASSTSIKPIPKGPPYDSAVYIGAYTAQNPLIGFPPIEIDPVTGLITGTPSQLGRFLVTVCCHEWRGGRIINTIRREFQFVVTDCSKKVVACIPQYSSDINTYIVECRDFKVNFVNCSSGGFSYHWDFGVEGTNADTSNEFQPSFVYPDTGVYTVRLTVNPGSTCPDSISRFVKIFPVFRTAFTDSGLFCPGSPIQFTDQSSASIKPILFWKWTFGDGDSATEQNPAHTYKYGGTYNVQLVSSNVKNCIDTSLMQVIVSNFKPFAGHDTIIIKNESIQFNANGGTSYLWTPATYLNNPNISDPVGFYPDTGRFSYSLFVKSAYGCSGYDTVRVWVVNEAVFIVPNAFTPNGDGRNDVFRPVAVGYTKLNYLRVYNRFGEQVYLGTSLTDGWDGTYKQQQAELGTYYWQISYVDRFGKDSYMKGDVTLIR